MNKTVFRNKMKQRLLEMTDTEFLAFSENIKDKLLESTEWIEAKTVGITISTGREVDTKGIIEEGWRQQKRIVVPKCYPSRKEIKFYEITSYTELEDSFYSLKEPITNIAPLVSKEEIDLLIVPGIIFDKRGFRIGYGGGYYDRFLSNYQNKTLSLAFDFQIVNDIPTETHDIAVGKIIHNT
ncbi:5-formyltetrahydrofolate cyclo-ligase [Anaerobacillus alkaliphilus]|uniref:5-formyltetrahydrofolate cyclo-ligase n=1 Tax=Anaerobacillus alkaliphilus TaxID=1548597 RepID=A0A4Q0VSB6_9BACI|nr:5-formyltetrahydrofolate cyclo-ligase [Anaerobacillus alkaliphilus]RXI99451.1 5-formyltetrahydrofolate cyclo-ligase [Anaerobacillus alkaliphilus]